MLLSRAAEVALKALPHFDPRGPEAPGREIRILSLACGESAPFLGKVLQKLARAGLLRWKRGRTGGFVLGRPASEITLADIAFARTARALQMPADKVWWGVEGITGPVSGLVQSCSISESVQIQEEEDAEGKITALAVHGYKATAQLEMLTSAEPPAPGTTLDLFGSFLVTSSETKWAKGQMRSISVEGTLLPGITA